MRLLLIALLLVVAVTAQDEPSFLCPVTGDPVAVHPTVSVNWMGDQQLFFCCPECLKVFLQYPHNFTLAQPGDVPASDLNRVVLCPVTLEKVEIAQNTSRIQFSNGQVLLETMNYSHAMYSLLVVFMLS
jgi:hypothetical protein